MSQDPLQYLPIERWSELQDVFKSDWPRGVSGYAVLETQRKLIDLGFDYGFKVYCPFGDMWKGMVAINEKDKFYEIIIQCPRDDTTKLEDALKRTKIVDWERSIIIPYAPYHIIECVQRAFKDRELFLLPSKKFMLEKTFDDVSLPHGLTFDLLTLEHVDLVDSTWPHRYKNSDRYFKFFINTKSGYGLFRNSELICWVLINESGPLLHLYTVEKERKKGYAELLIKLVSNILIKENKPVLAFCVKENYNASKLYTKVGFTELEPVAWGFLNKNDYIK